MVGATILVAALFAWSTPIATTADDVDLDKLLDLYKSYGLPLPPKNAVPVVFRTRFRDGDLPGGGPAHIVVFKYTSEDGKTRFMYGPVDDWKPQDNTETELSHQDGEVRALLSSDWSYSDERVSRDVGQDNMLATGMQAYSLGHKDLAQFLVSNDRGGQFARIGWYGVSGAASDERRVTYLALHDALNDWTDPAHDRIEVAERIQEIVATGQIYSRYSLMNEFRDKFMSALQETVRISLLPDNPIEYLIDGLVMVEGRLLSRSLEIRIEHQRLLVELGADAIPTLAEHLEDDRLTGIPYQGMNNSHPGILRVGNLVSEVLSLVTNGYVCGRSEAYGKEIAHAYLRWQETGDKTIYFRAVVDHGRIYPECETLGEYVSEFPGDFLKKLEQMIEEGTGNMGALAESIPSSNLTDDQKVSVLTKFGEKVDGAASWAIRNLLKFSVEDARRVFASWFERAFSSQERNGLKGWRPMEIGYYMVRVGDQELWERFERVLVHADSTTKIWLIAGLSVGGDGVYGCDPAVKLLMAMMADESAVPVTRDPLNWPGRFGGPYEGQTMGDLVTVMLYKAIVVRNPFTERPPKDAAGVEEVRQRLLRELKRLGYIEYSPSAQIRKISSPLGEG
ncbi:MAG: hypothetical protein IH944_09870 [Armatimonadetes bacterium]|nr:hypothetical protein [Armatimonadota bacterium]